MCGIVGYLGETSGIEYILLGLKLLQNRGYDSTGISYIIPETLHTVKYASSSNHNSLEKLEEKMVDIKSNLCIGHTRWATHGGKTDVNAHPHQDNKNRISLVHNGIIENYDELKTNLINLGYIFHSQTDTEVIAVLIGKYLDDGMSMDSAIKSTISSMSGTWALVIIHVDYPHKMWLTRNGSPLLLGLEDEYIIVASEQIAFGNHINKYIVLDNHDLIEVSKEGKQIKYNKDIHCYAIKNKSEILVETHPYGYAHWMLKEIYEQPDSILRAMNNGGRIHSNVSVKLGGLDANRVQLLESTHLILLGCGTSFHAGMWSVELFKILDIFDTVSIFDGADFYVKDIPKKGKTCVLLLSQSGETKDLHRCIQIAKEFDLIMIGVVNVVDSLIARETDCGVYLNAGREVAVASTKSFTSQCIILSMIAVWFSQNRGTSMEKRKKIISDMRNLPMQMQKVIEDTESIIDKFIQRFNTESAFILGKGACCSVALEGALKIKEVSYIHAEGYSTSSLKHGPFALISPNMPIILLDIGDEHRDKTQNAYQEIKARDAYILRITDSDIESNSGTDCDSSNIIIERNQTYGGILAGAVLQILSYRLAIKRDFNPDFPRNLAKVVTVE